MSRLILSLLGRFQATLEGQPISTFESDKVRALLVYLAVESRRPHSREKLAGLLWSTWPKRSARANLSHALSTLRQAIGDGGADPPVLFASRQDIEFNPHGDVWVDVGDFAALAGRRDRASMEQAAELYRGRFLEGFSLPDSPAFEDWLLLEQEYLHRMAMRVLGQLVEDCERQGDPDRALHWVWRQLELEPSWESAYRQAMHLLARTGQRDAALAQYHACIRHLADELEIEPSAGTTLLYEQILSGQIGAAPVGRGSEPVRLGRPDARPAFLETEAPVAAQEAPLFVARERELAWLEQRLHTALAGRGQIAFVVGGAGRGKTALLHEFGRRALDAHPDLLLALGSCDGYAGTGDPYLPFRQAMAMLSGDVEAHWAAGTLSTEHARRLWRAMQRTGAIVARAGPGLVGTLLTGRELLARGRAAGPDPAWLPDVACLADPACSPAAGLEQSQLFEQVAAVLLALAAQGPVLLILDDLQWADVASIGLLFYLARKIESARVLIAAAYRPDDLALGRGGGRHPLEPILAELRRQFGDVWLDLVAAGEAEGQTFVDSLLDAQPNVLDVPFRQALVRQTGGHPLFTVELVRDMKERGILVPDALGRWQVAGEPDWGTLPARAEAIITERLARLPRELHQVLATASVEGEEFTVQVVALVHSIDELALLQTLREELAGRHRLVREQGEVRSGERALVRYRFSHFLFQQHLYHSLGEVERRLLHHRVGRALEQLHAGRLDDVAVQLAHHFAGDPQREGRYLRLAGQRAAAQLAFDEAVEYYSRALRLVPPADAAARLDLLLLREQVYGRQRRHGLQAADLAERAALAEQLGAPRQRAEVALRLSAHCAAGGDYAAAAVAAQEALAWAEAGGDRSRRAAALLCWGDADFRLPGHGRAQAHWQEALRLSREAGDDRHEVMALFHLGRAAQAEGAFPAAREYYEAMLRRAGEADLLDLIGENHAAGARTHLAEDNLPAAQQELNAALRHMKSAEPLIE
jgi:DNA-binding SARP family transcriptional activator/tetratricopeptide (TPR) repeat protein